MVPAFDGRRESEELTMPPLSIRWAIRLRQTSSLPHFESLFRQAILSLSTADVHTQRRFHFADDALACVLGRLATRRAFTEVGVSWNGAPSRVVRDTRGKPRDTRHEIKFNVSHQGDLVVLAATTDTTVTEIGVDVMRIDQDKEEAATRIQRLKNAFTDYERRTMLAKEGEKERWRSFYRHWCLKEAVLKATGKGISEDLGKLEFHLKEELESDTVIYSTEYYQDGVSQGNFIFEESTIGRDHVVAVGNIVNETFQRSHIDRPPLFKLVDLPFLLDSSSNQCEDINDADEFDLFMAKPWKTAI
ncbi:hypothetical protein PENTCL1PPCAC_1982 [Pristionchus entomophagus]|uniref:L-aminoadipate-semialdehyde dehydrogenase-phosphopantetheinyl transferase n=1 Tax=Pristionchus entomophagus TaxID=358040 RepID=A0AAV5SB13_9BILA|nr:hypothetical protein PENTCL1PPCAC_1982 [Pristionchus entomophagus]